MPTYEYECEKCGFRFEQRQLISEHPVSECPECGGNVRRLLSGGAGFFLKGGGTARPGHTEGTCSLEETRTTCCGRSERCGKPPCREK
jgi:putative FmdB family regulatory protein